jgi:hypothetical protein
LSTLYIEVIERQIQIGSLNVPVINMRKVSIIPGSGRLPDRPGLFRYPGRNPSCWLLGGAAPVVAPFHQHFKFFLTALPAELHIVLKRTPPFLISFPA